MEIPRTVFLPERVLELINLETFPNDVGCIIGSYSEALDAITKQKIALNGNLNENCIGVAGGKLKLTAIFTFVSRF